MTLTVMLEMTEPVLSLLKISAKCQYQQFLLLQMKKSVPGKNRLIKLKFKQLCNSFPQDNQHKSQQKYLACPCHSVTVGIRTLIWRSS